jgi:hypothetical protein
VLAPSGVGKGAKIGAGSVVLKEVPPGSTVIGIPGRIVRGENGERTQQIDLNQVNLPDPVAQKMQMLLDRIEQLEKCFIRREQEKECQECPDMGRDDASYSERMKGMQIENSKATKKRSSFDSRRGGRHLYLRPTVTICSYRKRASFRAL